MTMMLGLMNAAHAEQPLRTTYVLNCAGCHGLEGHGVPEIGIPDFHQSGRFVKLRQGREYLIQVPGVAQSKLDDQTIADLMNYILTGFSARVLPADFKPYTADEVTQFRRYKAADAAERRVVLRRQLATYETPAR
jgi:mono/diheme cytochrome c family protein